ncbi:MAG: gamma-glutamyl-gamma-aminobutyrate hydrolase family protein [Nocardioides sp.]|nr:gamma-glutamyl-gamma-aminobutyrate hydrolase family protein [Nocardioides sp.]
MNHSGSRPVIGLTTYREQTAWGVWSTRADVLHAEYADAVVAAGGVPVLLPPASRVVPSRDTGLSETARAVVARIDGLVVSGGADVDPTLYGEAPHPRTSGWREERDAWERALLEAADEVALPTLGVCRGMQLMAVAGGGALDQHTPDVVGHDDHSPGGPEYGEISVRTSPGTRVGSAVGDATVVQCHHHQSVREHPGFTATAWAADGTVEAMEREGGRFCVGVQWHPEVGRDHDLFAALVAAASGRADSRVCVT